MQPAVGPVGFAHPVDEHGTVRRHPPLRRTVLHIFIVTALAVAGLLAALLHGLVQSEDLQDQANLATRALLAGERARDAAARVDLPDSPGRGDLEMALLRGNLEDRRRALDRYQHDALLSLLEVQRIRAREQATSALISGFLALSGAAGLLALLLMLQQRILTPIEDLNRLAGQVLEGHLDRRAPRLVQPEFDLLANTMNAMLDRLQGRLRDLEAGRRSLADLVAATPTALVEVGADGRIISANPAARALVGQDLEGLPAAECLPLRDPGGASFWDSQDPEACRWLLGENPVAAARVPLTGPSILVQLRDLRQEIGHSGPDAATDAPPPPEEFRALTGREQEIFCEIARGRSNREIAELLVISEGTVKTHVNNLLRKLDLRDRVQVLLYAARNGLLPEDGREAEDL